MFHFGPAIKLLRKERSLTLQALEDLSGIPRGTINSYELENRNPSGANLGKIAKALDIPIGVIYYLAEQEYKKGGSTETS